MKNICSAIALVLMSGSTLAADLPSHKDVQPPPAPPVWTGFYAGLNVGYGFGTNSAANSSSFSNSPFSFYTGPAGIYSPSTSSLGASLAMSGVSSMAQSGVIGGGQVGYNYQLPSNIVVGIEADMQDAGITGIGRTAGVGAVSQYAGVSATQAHYLDSTAIGVTQVNAGVNWMGTLRARLGYAISPAMLIYATGGLSYGGVYADVANSSVSRSVSNAYNRTTGAWLHDHGPWNHIFVGGGSQSSVLAGWNVGGGLEWMFMPNWSLKAEGIYWNMGNRNVSTSAVAFAPTTNNVTYDQPSSIGAYAFGNTNVNYQGVIVRMGVNYHFELASALNVVKF
jgi:outer membrane immunogenic protein